MQIWILFVIFFDCEYEYEYYLLGIFTNIFEYLLHSELTPDAWHMTHSVGWTFSQNFSSPALTVGDRQCLKDSELKNDSINRCNELITKVCIEQPWLHMVCNKSGIIIPLTPWQDI